MIEWLPSGPQARLTPNEIRVYRCSLEASWEELTAFAGTLTAEEQERADRFFFPRDRNHFVKGRGTLRIILGKLLGLPPSDVPLRKGKYGKPHLDTPKGTPPLHFNLSHSQGLILYAFSVEDEIGIDLEKIRSDGTLVRSVSEFFTPAERARIEEPLQCGQFELFYRCWVMKEAYTKARGDGLQIPLNSFELPPAWPDSELAKPVLLEGWTITPFRPEYGYVAALARPHGSKAEVKFRDW